MPIQPITPVMIDWLTVIAEGPPEAHGFRLLKNSMYTDGKWTCFGKTIAGRLATMAWLSGEECAKVNGHMARWTVPVKITRMDVTRDVVDLPINPALPYLFAGTRKKHKGWLEHEVRCMRCDACARRKRRQCESPIINATAYVGSSAAPMMLRMYTKRDQGEWLQNVWAFGGWRPGVEVTRVEYQCRTRQVERAAWNGTLADWSSAAHRLWDDALARYRLCTALPSLYKQANEARTHPAWEALAHGVGPRKLRVPTPPQLPPTGDSVTRAMERFALEGGDVALLQRVAASLARVHGG